MFNKSFKRNYEISYDDWYTERRLATDTSYQVDIGSAQSVNSPEYLVATHQTAAGFYAPDKNINIERFGNLNVRKCFVEIYGYRFPRDSVLTIYALKNYIDQYRD